ncbi:hypothetical protein BJ684DRAFT_17539, partial [Piptocephalis cylindrospora]
MLWFLIKTLAGVSVTYVFLFHLVNFLLIRQFGLRVGSVRFRSVNDLFLSLPGSDGSLEVGRIELKVGWPRWKNGRRRWWSVAISNVIVHLPQPIAEEADLPVEPQGESTSTKASSGARRAKKRKDEKRKSRREGRERRDTPKGPLTKLQTLIEEWSASLHPSRRPESVSWVKACSMDVAVWAISCGEVSLSNLSIPLSPVEPSSPRISLPHLTIRPCLLTSLTTDSGGLIWPFTIDITLYALALVGSKEDIQVIQVPSLVFRIAGGLSGFKVVRKKSFLHNLQTEWRMDSFRINVDALLHLLSPLTDNGLSSFPTWSSKYTLELLEVIMQGARFSAYVTDRGITARVSLESLAVLGNQPGFSLDTISPEAKEGSRRHIGRVED